MRKTHSPPTKTRRRVPEHPPRVPLPDPFFPSLTRVRAAATLAALGLLGVAVRADEPPAAPPVSPTAAPAAAVPAKGADAPPAPPVAGSPSGKPLGSAVPPAPPYKTGLATSSPFGAGSAAYAPYASGGGAGLGNGGGFLGKWAKDVRISGGASLGLRNSSVSGGAGGIQSYQDETTYSYDERKAGPLNMAADLTLSGKLFGLFSIDARVSNSRYGNYFNNRFGLNYDNRKGTKIDLGDVNASLSGNELVSFSKNLTGLMLSRDFGGGKVRMSSILSLTRAQTRRGSFRGNGSSGPYTLYAPAILEGTERLRLNGQDLERGDGINDGDYTIEYYTGTVTFTKGRIINESDLVEYTYESQSYNSTPGLLTGMRWEMAGGGGNAFGLTWLQQKASGLKARTGEVTERFPVVNDLTYRYTLSSLIEPAAPVEVRWLEQVLVEGVDYVLHRDLHFLLLKRPLPPDTAITGTASLIVKYRPVRTSAVGGDRMVMGLDGTVRLGQNGNLGIQFGRSQSPDGTGTGSGLTMTARLQGDGKNKRNRWGLTTSYRDIGANFSTIDSVSGVFLRAEKSLVTNLSFAPTEFITMTTLFTRGRVAQRDYGYFGGGIGGGNAANPDAVTWLNNSTLTTNVNLALPRLPTFSFSHSQITQDGATRSSFTSDQLSMSWQKGILGLTGAFGRTASRGQSVFLSGSLYGTPGTTAADAGTLIGGITNPGSGLSSSDSSSTTSRFSVSLTPAPWVSLKSNIGFSSNRFGSSSSGGAAATGTSSRARDMAHALTLTPLRNLTVSANLSDTSNGQSLSGYYSPNLGGGIGAGGAGGAGTGSPSPSSSSFLPGVITGQRTRTRQLSLQYQPWTRLTLTFDTSRQLSLIPGYDNTESATTQFSANVGVSDRLQLTGQFSDQKVTYVGSQGNSANRTYLVAATAGPFGRVSITSSLQRMNTGSALYYGVNNIGGGGILSPTGTIGGVGGVGGGYGYGTGLGTGYNGGGVGVSYPGVTGFAQQQNLNIFSAQVDYLVGGGRTLFARWQSLDTRSPYAASETQFGGGSYRSAANTRRAVGTIGFYLPFTSIMGLTIESNLIRLTDRDNSRYSYNARTMNMDLSARF